MLLLFSLDNAASCFRHCKNKMSTPQCLAELKYHCGLILRSCIHSENNDMIHAYMLTDQTYTTGKESSKMNILEHILIILFLCKLSI